MNDSIPPQVFLSYNDQTREFVESMARRLGGDARLSFWFGPWHSVPTQEQMDEALWAAPACAIFVSSGEIQGWQNEQMRAAIQTRVEDEAGYRVIPVLLPGVGCPSRRELPRFLRRYEMVAFEAPDDERAFNRLLAGILGLPVIFRATLVHGFSTTGVQGFSPKLVHPFSPKLFHPFSPKLFHSFSPKGSHAGAGRTPLA